MWARRRACGIGSEAIGWRIQSAWRGERYRVSWRYAADRYERWPSDEEMATLVERRELSHAADVDADVLVMGAWGTSRWAERMLGGATRTVLASMTLPVLMSH